MGLRYPELVNKHSKKDKSYLFFNGLKPLKIVALHVFCTRIMLRFFTLSILISIVSLSAHAQIHEIGGRVLVSGYVGDINPTNYTDFSGSGFGIFYRKNFNKRISTKISLSKARVEGNDMWNSEQSLQDRGLSFRSDIYELAGQLEVSFFDFQVNEGKDKVTPYLFGGVGVFNFTPEAFYDGGYVELRPLGTEGQFLNNSKTTYSNIAASFPLGIGFKYNFAGKWCINSEVGMRYTTTDYLDDVSGTYADSQEILEQGGEVAAYLSNPSQAGNRYGNKGQQRGNDVFNDTYSFITFGISYTFKPFRCPELSDY